MTAANRPIQMSPLRSPIERQLEQQSARASGVAMLLLCQAEQVPATDGGLLSQLVEAVAQRSRP
jgi:hypothetical protein